MFNDEELEGCPSIQFEEWVQTQEARIREVSPRKIFTNYKDVEPIIQLLIDCWNAKKYTYA